MSLTVKDFLLKVRELLSEEQKWIQGVLARDEYNNSDSWMSSTACKFCLLGSVYRTSYDIGIDNRNWPVDIQTDAEDLLDKLAIERGSIGMVVFNDAPGRKHSEVLELLDEAIERA